VSQVWFELFESVEVLPVGFGGSTDSVAQEHGDGHGTYATGIGCNLAGYWLDSGKIHIPYQSA
ncbi:uncharacterized protein METZ01_LOCUS372954, partial [marine metagenome]